MRLVQSAMLAALVVPIAVTAALGAVFPIQGRITAVNADGSTLTVGDRFSGRLDVDPTGVPMTGMTQVPLTGASDLRLDFSGLTLLASDDASFGAGFPAATVTDGVPTGIDFFVASVAAFGLPAPTAFQAFPDGFIQFFDPGTDLSRIEGQLSIVPLPGGIVLLASALGGLALVRRVRGRRG